MALDFQRPDPSSPAAVASAQFTITRRGYREEEVRDFLRQVSVEMARLLERERFLENELKALQARGSVDVTTIDEATITELLGAEAARVLSAAREAAQSMRDRASESAEQIVREASREAARMLEESTLEASRRRTDVSSEAEQELELAKQQGREMVAEVRAYRERVLTDLAKRTDEARRELEHLVHERERLLNAFERARHAASDVVGDLTEFDEAIRGTGVVPPLVPPDAPPPPRPTRGTDTPIFDAMEYVHELGAAHRPNDADAEAGDMVEAAKVSETVESVAVEPVVEEPIADESVVFEPSETPQPVIPDQASETTPTSTSTEHMATVVNIFDRRKKKDSPEPSSAPDHPVFERIEAQPSEPVAPPKPSRVDEIFERLRSATPQRVVRETKQAVESGEEPPQNTATKPEAATVKTGARSNKSVVPPSVDPSVFRLRDEAVSSVLEPMLRTTKLLLADGENDALTHIGAKRSSLTIEAMLPAVDEHAQHFAEALREHLTSIAVEAARSLTDARRSDLRMTVGNGSVFDAITRMIVSDLVRPLHDRVVRAIDEAAGDRDALMRLVRAVFADTKSQHAESVIADIANFAYARGLFLACDAKTHVCWAADPNGPACADAEDNALAGATRHGDAFPTGHEHPLAHAGCRCLVVPLDK